MLRTTYFRLAMIVLVCCLSSFVSLAQTPTGSGNNDWNNVLRIKPSASLAVELLNGVHINGKFVRADASNITLRIDRGEHFVPRENVGRITRISHRWLWIGLAGGIGAGAAWEVSATQSDIAKGEFFQHTARNKAYYWIPAVGGTILGALADVARKPIYKVQNK